MSYAANAPAPGSWTPAMGAVFPSTVVRSAQPGTSRGPRPAAAIVERVG